MTLKVVIVPVLPPCNKSTSSLAPAFKVKLDATPVMPIKICNAPAPPILPLAVAKLIVPP